MQLFLVPAEHIEHFWPVAAPLLEAAIAYTGGTNSLATEHAEVVAKRKQLWVVGTEEGGKPTIKAAGITSLQRNADGTITANIEYFGGEDMKAWFSLKGDFENWAKDEGCRDLRLWARKGWAKHLPEYRITHYILKKDLA